MSKIEVVFFGTGPVAAESLDLLVSDFDVVAVVTKPRPEHHRGSFPVIDVAIEHGLPLHFVSNKQELSELVARKPFKTDVAILIDFGIIVTKDVIDYFPKGIINSHFSLLPEWRGADPISFALLSGQPKTGVSLMLIDEGMDTGKIIRQKSLPIAPDATNESLTSELIQLSDRLLKADVPAYLAGELPPRSQPHPDRATYSRKLTKEDGRLDWGKPADLLEREIRTFKEWPKSYTNLAGIDVIITSAYAAPGIGAASVPGDISQVNDAGIIMIATSNGSLCITKLKPVGKSEMTAKAFLAGYGSRLSK